MDREEPLHTCVACDKVARWPSVIWAAGRWICPECLKEILDSYLAKVGRY